eukprot:1363805-Rhodomonas_salina.1
MPPRISLRSERVQDTTPRFQARKSVLEIDSIRFREFVPSMVLSGLDFGWIRRREGGYLVGRRPLVDDDLL